MQFRKRSCDKGLQTYGRPSVVKVMEKNKKFTFQAIVKKANCLACFSFLAYAG